MNSKLPNSKSTSQHSEFSEFDYYDSTNYSYSPSPGYSMPVSYPAQPIHANFSPVYNYHVQPDPRSFHSVQMTGSGYGYDN